LQRFAVTWVTRREIPPIAIQPLPQRQRDKMKELRGMREVHTVRPFNVALMIAVIIGLLALLVWTQEKRKSTQIWVWVVTALILILMRAFLPDSIGPASWADVADWIMPDGYVPHSVESLITVQDNWIIGEAKDCSSSPLNFKAARLIDQEPGYVALGFNCDDGPLHSIKVTLYGHLNQPEHKIAYWRCTRESEGFTCRQTGAE